MLGMMPYQPLQLGELCRRLGVPDRHARYLLEHGYLPKGVDPHPHRGHHRRFEAGQAFWLGLVLKLKQAGLRAPLAAQVADFAEQALRTTARQLGWDPGFDPFRGRLEAGRRWAVEVGELRFIRLAVDCDPSGRPVELPWAHLGRRRAAPGAEPVVTLRIDLSRLARLLRTPAAGEADGESPRPGGT